MDNDELSPAQIEFRDKLTRLMGEYAQAVGPAFDGNDEGLPMAHPVVADWLLIASWEDAGSIRSNGDASTVVIDSNVRYPTRLGLLQMATEMALSEIR